MIGLDAVVCAAIWFRPRRARPSGPTATSDALLLLALVLLFRAALDPWNNLYYHIPFLFALMAYEVRAGRVPLLTVGCSLLLTFIVPVKGIPHMSNDLRAAVYGLFV